MVFIPNVTSIHVISYSNNMKRRNNTIKKHLTGLTLTGRVGLNFVCQFSVETLPSKLHNFLSHSRVGGCVDNLTGLSRKVIVMIVLTMITTVSYPIFGKDK